MTIRNKTLFFEIADVMEFTPWNYDQQTWGRFRPGAKAMEAFERLWGYQTDDTEDYGWTKVEECGTALCLAGHAALLTGWFPTKAAPYEGREQASWVSVAKEPYQSYVAGENVSDVAQEALGIGDDEAQFLFAGGQKWTADDIRAFGRGEPILKHLDESDVRDDEV